MSLVKKYKFQVVSIAIAMAFMALTVLSMSSSVFAQCVSTIDGSGVQCQALLAGQTIDAGLVCVEVVGTDLVVTYDTANGWELVETHLWVGDSLADMPQTKQGNPKIGNFPYNSGDITGATSYNVSISLDDL
ncbi:MAG: hypothetical protein ACMUIP_05955 [bacterium]